MRGTYTHNNPSVLSNNIFALLMTKLTMSELRLCLFLAMYLNYYNGTETEASFTLREYKRITGLQYLKSRDLTATIEKLMGRQFGFWDACLRYKETNRPFVVGYDAGENGRDYTLYLDTDTVKFISELSGAGYFSVDIDYMFALTKTSSVKLYCVLQRELSRLNGWHKDDPNVFSRDISYMARLFTGKSTVNFADFNKDYLIPAQQDILSATGLVFDIIKIRRGRRVTGLTFMTKHQDSVVYCDNNYQKCSAEPIMWLDLDVPGVMDQIMYGNSYHPKTDSTLLYFCRIHRLNSYRTNQSEDHCA